MARRTPSLKRRRTRGFTLLEIVAAMTVLAAASLMLVAAISSQQQMNALARERSLATNAIRAYVEAMRQYYPSSGSTDMSGFLYDTSTPADYLPGVNATGTSSVEASAMRGAAGLVLRMTDETGVIWGPGAGASTWGFTDSSMLTVGSINTSGTMPSIATFPYTFGSTSASGATTTPSLTELDSMGYISLASSTQVAGRDLDGSGTIANTQKAGEPPTGGSGNANHVDPTKQLFVPTQITLSWVSGSSMKIQRQRITIYAAFGPTR